MLSILSGSESGSNHGEKSPSLMRSNMDQGRRSKEVSPKTGEHLKEHPKRKRPKSRSKSSNDRNTDEEGRNFLIKKAIRKVEETFAIFARWLKASSVLKHKSSILSGSKSGSSDGEKSPSLMKSNNDQGQRSKEVSPKLGECLKEHPKRKRPKSCSKSSNDKSTDEEGSS